MSIFDFFIGIKGEFILSLLQLPLIILMWVLAFQLFEKRKRKSYALLTKISLGFLLINLVLLGSTLIVAGMGDESHFLSSLVYALNNAGFLTILFGYYRIHNKADVKTFVVYLGPAVISAVAGVLSPWASNCICLISIAAISYFYNKKIGRGKHILFACFLFMLQLLLAVITDFYPSLHGGVYLIKLLLTIGAYTFLLIHLLDHSMLIMQSSYVSAITDPLTGLFNRRYFTKFMTRCIERNMPVHVIFSDIDNFKKLNDTMGHKVGDDVLKQTATIFMEEVEGFGIAGRYGGEEMVVLIMTPDVDMNEITERMRARIEMETIATVSIGYRSYEAGVAPDQLIKQADEAMYTAKHNGKNRVCKYHDPSTPNPREGVVRMEDSAVRG